MMLVDIKDLSIEVDSATDIEALESFGEGFAKWQRGVNWWIGDLAKLAARRWPSRWEQVFPEWISPGLVARCKAVSEAYPESDRNILATWTQHMKVANQPNRVALVAGMVDRGETSDQSRATVAAEGDGKRWLLAVDVNYYLHRFWYSGAGVESAKGVADWIQRTSERLQEKGLTDVVCCFDAPTNHRKELTADWPDRYKDRPQKEQELRDQLNMVRGLLESHNLCCVSVPEMEADDILASYAKRFGGRVTILSQDKDLRQCLSQTCNMLLDVEWKQDELSGNMLPEYKWLSAKQHTDATGIRPDQWTEFQCLMGDVTDGITGCKGIGEKGAADLIQTFGTAEAVIEAARNDDERIRPKKREALIEFAERLDVTRQLVTLRTDLEVPRNTRIGADRAAAE